ncbi:c-type cytochrome [Halomonas alkalisoli]|uniref:c-type cytochrome n=1 Tax=Halomonas alkalisoli TaxID=2907158 RepID=UPI001F1D8216|nr:c-type cytochrome [Halomonas alkalisoli]MCE9682574.1 c-type cytochrome [Halomonas alkalisoli]
MITLLLSAAGPLAFAEEGPDGRTIYMKNCSVCHGESGDGRSGARFGLNPPPSSFTENYHGDRDRMLGAVIAGVPGTAMVGWSGRLSQVEIEAAVDYLLDEVVSTGRGAPQSSGALSIRDLIGEEAVAPHGGVDPHGAMPRESSRETVPAARRPPPVDSEAAQLYARNCSVCHGEDGTGALWGRQGFNQPPVDFTDSAATEGMNREAMIAIATHGKPGTAMVGFGGRLSSEAIESIVDYIRAAFMGEPSGGDALDPALGLTPRDRSGYAPVPMEVPMPDGLVGNVARGAGLYAANCVMCHGASGQGDGRRAYFIIPRPRDFTAAEVRPALNRPAIFAAVKHGVRGREMPGWRLVLSDQEMADVSEYVFRTYVASE